MTGACASDPEVRVSSDEIRQEIDLLAGCWAVESGEWVDTPEQLEPPDAWADSASVTWSLRFDTVPPPMFPEARPEARRADTFLEGAWRDHPFQRWWTAGDSLFIDHPAAFAGTTLRLVSGDDGFTGVATAHTDAQVAGEPTESYAAIRLRPAACPE